MCPTKHEVQPTLITAILTIYTDYSFIQTSYSFPGQYSDETLRHQSVNVVI